jgi:hypothetical protein
LREGVAVNGRALVRLDLLIVRVLLLVAAVGSAQAHVEAVVMRLGGGSHQLEAVAAGDDTFSFDFAPFLDWEANDLVRAWQ